MRLSKLPALAAILLLFFATVQCVASCVESPGQMPPCHRHAGHSCDTPVFAEHARVHAAPVIVLQAALADATPVVPLTSQPAPQLHPLSPPLDSSGPSIAILRI
jgi:hypothetical protein